MTAVSQDAKGDVWFVYDGDCPVCNTAADYWRLREAVGTLHLVNAREEGSHPLMREIKAKGLDLDKGMVVKFQDTCYHGADALHVMALLGTRQNWFNRTNAFLFRSKALSVFCYPAMRAASNLALKVKGVPLIRNLEKDE